VIKPVHFYKDFGDPIEKDGLLRYPDLFNEQRLAQLQIEKGIVQYSAQYELKCLADKTQIFKREAMHVFKMAGVIKDKCRRVGYHDPALGESEKACFAPIVTGYIPNYDDAENNICKGDILIVDMYVERMPPSEGRRVMAKLHELHNYAVMGCENNGFQSVYAQSMVRIQIGEKMISVPIYPITNTGAKPARIESFEPYYTNGAVKFRDDWRTAPNNYREGLSQLWNYPLDTYRDVPDALDGLMQTARQSTVMIG
jgi:predicted phage terminase large subunit-like protein